ncbi:hypothetical protein G7043_10210 [Lentzea sp. NEAU-D13]|uniref:Uncharacterized protein n=1 Tax=Lentzea alba TaxID=2714351 RepID=A0A7C9VS01_9PSEU|nr:hypothetical protein [Lentzea alba]NGY59296.1 hypothetical protein [Lentzea alba]
MVTRAVMGAIAGLLGAVGTGSALVGLYLGFCGFVTPKPWERRECVVRESAEQGILLVPVVLLVGLIGTALLHVWLLKLRDQPRPWSVVVPGTLLVIALLTVRGSWGLIGALAVPATAFAVAGVITGFGPWREILRARAR